MKYIILLTLVIITMVVYLNRKWNSGYLCIGIANSPAPLNIPTYDGGNQGLHPSCLYFNKGFGGHKFWFVFTPYKDMNDAIENPCVYFSDDGEHFVPVEGAYPLDDIFYSKEEEYNSDPELVYNSNTKEIECWWRRVQTGKFPIEAERNREVLYRSRSKNGVDWTQKETMLVYNNIDDETHGLISPALIFEDDTYKMWVSNGDNQPYGTRSIDYYEMPMHGKMELKHCTKLTDNIPHHLDVWKDGSVYYLIGFDCTKSSQPYVAYSFNDPKDNMSYLGVVMTRGRFGHWDDGRLYRPSVVGVGSEFYLYYSAYERFCSCHTGLIKFTSINKLRRKFLFNY